MKKYTAIVEKKKEQLLKEETLNERNMYLDFSKKYHKKHGVSGPFDKKFKGDKEAQKKYMAGLSKAWEEHKKKKGIKIEEKLDLLGFSKEINEGKVIDMAKEMVGDGGDPNFHFVTMCDDYCFERGDEMVKYSAFPKEAPLKIKTTPEYGAYTFGPFQSLEEAKMFAESIDLDEINGPRTVKIEDRKTGEVFTKYLSCKLQPVWDEHITLMEEEEPEVAEEPYEDPSTEYTFGDEEE